MRYDFSYVQALQAKARRERSEAIYQMLVAPLIALIKHASRPHLARQG